MEKELRFTTTRYLKELDNSFNNGKISYLKYKAKFPWGIITIYAIAGIILGALSNTFEIVSKIAPLAVVIFLFHIITEFHQYFKAKKASKKLGKGYRKVSILISGYDHVKLKLQGINATIELSKKSGEFQQLLFPSVSLHSLNMGMGRYIEMQNEKDTFIIPSSLFTQKQFEEITAPFWKVFKQLTRQIPISAEDRVFLKTQVPHLYQGAGMK